MSKDTKTLSVAYGMQRQKPKKYAGGGIISGRQEEPKKTETEEGEPVFPAPTSKYAQGGLVSYKNGSISEAIMNQRRKVDSAEMEDQDVREENQSDDLSLDADMKEYHGFNNENEDLNERADGYKQDIVGSILKAMREKKSK